MLDTTPNADINETWNKQVRKRDAGKEMGPAFRYSHRNTCERLQDKALKDPLSSELIGCSQPNTSTHKSMAHFVGGSISGSTMNKLNNN